MELETRKLSATAGWLWFREGWLLFTKAPGPLILFSSALLLGVLLLGEIPQIGPLVAILLMPVMIAGYLKGFEVLQQGGTFLPAYLLAGIRENMPALVILGGINFAIQMLVQAAVQSGQFETMALGLFIGLLMMMATHFAPALILFHQAGVLTALQVSLRACLRNLVPLLLYGLLMLGPTILAVVSLVGVVLLLPVMLAGTYVSYRTVFLRPGPGVAAEIP